MDIAFLISLLAIGTMLAVAVFALWSRNRTLDAMHDPNHQKSTLAADAPDRRGD